LACHAPFRLAALRAVSNIKKKSQRPENFSRWLTNTFSMQNKFKSKTRKATKLLVTNNFWRFLYGKLAAAIKCQKHVSVWPCICSVCVINKNPECHANGTTGVV